MTQQQNRIRKNQNIRRRQRTTRKLEKLGDAHKLRRRLTGRTTNAYSERQQSQRVCHILTDRLTRHSTDTVTTVRQPMPVCCETCNVTCDPTVFTGWPTDNKDFPARYESYLEISVCGRYHSFSRQIHTAYPRITQLPVKLPKQLLYDFFWRFVLGHLAICFGNESRGLCMSETVDFF